MAEEWLKAERVLATEIQKELDRSREEAARLTGEKVGLSERLAKAEHLLVAAYATPESVVLSPN